MGGWGGGGALGPGQADRATHNDVPLPERGPPGSEGGLSNPLTRLLFSVLSTHCVPARISTRPLTISGRHPRSHSCRGRNRGSSHTHGATGMKHVRSHADRALSPTVPKRESL